MVRALKPKVVKLFSMKKHLPTIIPILIVTLISVYISTKIFKPGYIYFRDVTEGIEVDNLYKRYLYTFSDDVGESLAEKSRIPIFYTIFGAYSLGKTVGIFNDSDYVKVKILSLFISSLSIFIFTTYKILKGLSDDQEELKNRILLSLSASLGGVYYISNFWFSNRIAHFGLFFSTVTIPITFYLLFRYLFSENTDFRKLIFLLISTLFLTGTPHTVLIQVVIFFSMYLAFLINKGVNKKTKIRKSFQLLVFATLYFPLNSYWIMPFLSSLSQPDAALTETIVNSIGKNSNLYNSVRLTGYWLTSYQDYFVGIPKDIGNIISILPLFITIAALILIVRKKNIFLSILIILILGIFLSTSSDITNIFYFNLMFKSPIKSFGWLFREYDKMGVLTSFVYSLGISIFLAKGTKKKLLFSGSLLTIILILIVNLSFLDITLNKNYRPQQIPENFSKVLNLLKKDSNQFNTVWYPGVPQPTWAKEPEVRFWFANLISYEKPSITTSSEIMNYVNYIFNEENIYSIDVGKALERLGVKYLIIRKDYPYYYENDYEGKLEVQKSLKKIYNDNILTVYENLEFSEIVKFYQNITVTNQGLDVFKNNNDVMSDSLLIFSDKGEVFEIPEATRYVNNTIPIDYTMSKYKGNFIYPYGYSTLKYDGSSGAWKIGSLENLNHVETDFYFSNLGLRLPQFDYERGVIIAKEGFEKTSVYDKTTKEFTISFDENENATFEEKNLLIEIPTSPFDGQWNSNRSSLFELDNAKAIEVTLNSYIPEELEPHFKVSFFSKEGKNLKTLFMYPDRNKRVESILVVPNNSYFADFSVWTKNVFGSRNSLNVKNIRILDVSKIVKPISMEIKIQNKCLKDCTVFARVLMSRIGGEIGFKIDDNNFNVTTLKNYELEHNERYEWVKIGEVSELGKLVNIKIDNTEGFNSINCIAILNREQVRDIETETQKITESPIENIISNSSKPYISIEKINPSKYKINVKNTDDNDGILVFSKPFSKNWVINDQKSSKVNGYTNGWEIEKLENAEYIIEYKPQRYFYYGIAISLATLLGLAVSFHYSKTREVIASELKSKSQG